MGASFQQNSSGVRYAESGCYPPRHLKYTGTHESRKPASIPNKRQKAIAETSLGLGVGVAGQAYPSLPTQTRVLNQEPTPQVIERYSTEKEVAGATGNISFYRSRDTIKNGSGQQSSVARQ